jgi:hypothetical protein
MTDTRSNPGVATIRGSSLVNLNGNITDEEVLRLATTASIIRSAVPINIGNNNHNNPASAPSTAPVIHPRQVSQSFEILGLLIAE